MPPATGTNRRWRTRAWTVALLAVGLLAVQFAFRNADALADWYAGFAAQHLPASASSLAPAPSGRGAFFYCARQVSRRMEGDYSVETFPAREQSRTVRLDDGRFRIESYVDEARLDGQQVRHTFVCTTRFHRGRWVLEALHLTPVRLAEWA